MEGKCTDSFTTHSGTRIQRGWQLVELRELCHEWKNKLWREREEEEVESMEGDEEMVRWRWGPQFDGN